MIGRGWAVLLLGLSSCKLLLSALPAPLPPPPPPPPRWRAIHVVAVSYGQNCRGAGESTTAYLRQNCEGQPSCAYRIDDPGTGDPASGCTKDYVAEWRCGDDPTVHRATAAPAAGFGVVALRCD
jgi:hypothetical protein